MKGQFTWKKERRRKCSVSLSLVGTVVVVVYSHLQERATWLNFVNSQQALVHVQSLLLSKCVDPFISNSPNYYGKKMSISRGKYYKIKPSHHLEWGSAFPCLDTFLFLSFFLSFNKLLLISEQWKTRTCSRLNSLTGYGHKLKCIYFYHLTTCGWWFRF